LSLDKLSNSMSDICISIAMNIVAQNLHSISCNSIFLNISKNVDEFRGSSVKEVLLIK